MAGHQRTADTPRTADGRTPQRAADRRTRGGALHYGWAYISDIEQVWAPQLFYTYFYNHAHRLRLEKLLYIELSRSSNGFFKPLLDPDDRFNSETAERRFQK
jgi:hypothetical protein